MWPIGTPYIAESHVEWEHLASTQDRASSFRKLDSPCRPSWFTPREDVSHVTVELALEPSASTVLLDMQLDKQKGSEESVRT